MVQYTHLSDDERLKSVIDFIIVPATFISKIVSCKVGEWKCDLLSDHVPISASSVNCFNSNNDTFQPIQKVQFEKKKIKWESYDKEIICSYYTVELLDIDCNSGIDKLCYSLLRSVWSVSEANLDVKRVSSVRSQKFRKISNVFILQLLRKLVVN